MTAGVGHRICAPMVSWFRARIVLGFALMRDAYRLLEVATVAPSESWELSRPCGASDFMIKKMSCEIQRTQSPR